MQIKTFNSESELVEATVSFILRIQPRTIALSGGSTPRPVYQALSLLDLNSITFYQVDERYVPKNHDDSNYKIISENLAKPFHHFDTALPIGKALVKYAQEIPPSFDLVMLGIGTDGHIASLFPYSKALDEASTVAHTVTRQFPISDRLTLTFPPIMASKQILVLLKDKLKILTELKNPSKTVSEFPALRLLEHKNLRVHSY